MVVVRRLRTVGAHVVWWVSVLLAIGLAGAALLVALKADPSHDVWGTWIAGVEAFTPDWLARPEGPSLTAGSDRDVQLRRGTAAAGVLCSGALVQWLVRPRPA